MRLVCCGLVVWVGAIHVHLWSQGYKHLPTVGPLFLADAIGGFTLAALVLLWPRALAGLTTAGFMLSTLAGLVITINFGLFGFKESSGASFVTESVVLESAGAAIALIWVAVSVTLGVRERRRPPAASTLTAVGSALL